MDDQQGAYQLCGPNAFNRYGFDDQVPARLYAYNNRLSGDRTIGTIAVTLIKVTDQRLGSTEEVQSAEGLRLVYASRGGPCWTRCMTGPGSTVCRGDTSGSAGNWRRSESTRRELVYVTLRDGDIGTIRRMGLALEREGVPESLLRKLQRALKPSSGLIPWIPTKPKRGSVNRCWGVVENDAE